MNRLTPTDKQRYMEFLADVVTTIAFFGTLAVLVFMCAAFAGCGTQNNFDLFSSDSTVNNNNSGNDNSDHSNTGSDNKCTLDWSWLDDTQSAITIYSCNDAAGGTYSAINGTEEGTFSCPANELDLAGPWRFVWIFGGTTCQEDITFN